MKIVGLFFFSFFISSILFAQSEIFLGYKSGITTFYSMGGTILSQDITYFGFITWLKNRSMANSMSLRYKTRAYSIRGRKYKTMTDFSLSHRGYYDREYYNFLMMSSTLFLPKKVKEKKLNAYFGLRNTFMLANLVEEENNQRINRRNYVLGGEFLLNHRVNQKITIGISSYLDFTPVSGSRTGGWEDYTAELTMNLFYQIK